MLVFTLVLLCILALSSGLRNVIVIEDDYRPLIKIETFGVWPGGQIDLTVSNIRLNHPDAEKKTSIEKEEASKNNKIGFILRKSASESQAQQDIENAMEGNLCLFDTAQHKEGDIVFNVTSVVNTETHLHEHKDLTKMTDNKESSSDTTSTSDVSTVISKQYTITSETAGLYTLIFQRCPCVDDGHSITFTMNAIFRNPTHALMSGSGKQGREWDYLSAGDAPLPLIYMVFFVSFTGMLFVWLFVLKRDPEQYGKHCLSPLSCYSLFTVTITMMIKLTQAPLSPLSNHTPISYNHILTTHPYSP